MASKLSDNEPLTSLVLYLHSVKKHFNYLIVAGFMLLFLLSSCSSSKPISHQPTVNWLTFDQVQDSLRHSPKKVLVDVFATWCGPCKKMDKITYGNPEVIDYLNKHYYAVKFDAESMDTILFKSKTFTNSFNKRHTHNLTYELASINGHIAFPTTTILDHQLMKIETVAAMLNATEMLQVLHKNKSK